MTSVGARHCRGNLDKFNGTAIHEPTACSLRIPNRYLLTAFYFSLLTARPELLTVVLMMSSSPHWGDPRMMY